MLVRRPHNRFQYVRLPADYMWPEQSKYAHLPADYMWPEQSMPADYMWPEQSMYAHLPPLKLAASGAHLGLGRAPYVLYQVEYIDLASLAPNTARQMTSDGSTPE